MRLGYFGGSFDPPHCGHLAIASAARKAFALDTVLFVPTGNQPLKPSGPEASFNDRLAMVTLLCASEPAFKPSTLDAPLPDGAPNYTVDTLERLRTTLDPGDTTFLLVGIDAFLDIHRWRVPERLFELTEWIVVTRPGFALEKLAALRLTEQQRSRVHLLEGIEVSASSTEVRERIQDDEDCSSLVPASVLAYIESHHLYRPG